MTALAAALRPLRPAPVLAATAALGAVVLPSFGSLYVVEVGTTMLLYMTLCLGLNVVVGYAGLLDLGYAAFFAVGAYMTGILTTHYGVEFWLTLPIGIGLSCIAGVIIGAPTLRLRSDYLAIVTLGFGEIVRLVARNLDITGGPSGIVGIERPWLLGHRLGRVQDLYYLFLCMVVVTVVLCLRAERSRVGRAWRYIRSDEDAAAGIGIDRVSAKLQAYMAGAAIASVAGTFYAAKMTAISPESFTFTQSTLILLGVVLGGMGKVPGVLLGGAVMALIPELLRDAGTLRPLGAAASLLILMLFRPAGLWPERR